MVRASLRPFASPALVRRLLKATGTRAAAVPVLPVVDSTLQVDARGRVDDYLPRPVLRAVQTPQAFSRAALRRALRMDPQDWPDDGSWALAAGVRVVTVEGEATNSKITTAEELALARRTLARKSARRK